MMLLQNTNILTYTCTYNNIFLHWIQATLFLGGGPSHTISSMNAFAVLALPCRALASRTLRIDALVSSCPDPLANLPSLLIEKLKQGTVLRSNPIVFFLGQNR